MWGDAPEKDDEEDSEEGSSEEGSEEESEEDDAGPSKPAAVSAELSREERRNQKKAQKAAAIKAKTKAVEVGDLPPSESESEDEAMPANPNHSKAARNLANKPSPVDEATEGVKKMTVAAPASRREREALAAQEAKERYRKLHEAGKTDEAKADLARLKLIREKREQEAARKQVCSFILFALLGSKLLIIYHFRPRKKNKKSKQKSRGPRLRPRRPRSARQRWVLARTRRRNEAVEPALLLKWEPGLLFISYDSPLHLFPASLSYLPYYVPRSTRPECAYLYIHAL